MVSSCAVVGCTNRRQKDVDRSFHMFPFSDPERLQIWLNLVSRQDTNGKPWKPTKASRVCSDHFLPEDFELDTQNKVLRDTAVPSIFPNYLLLNQPVQKTSRRPQKRPLEMTEMSNDQNKEQTANTAKVLDLSHSPHKQPEEKTSQTSPKKRPFEIMETPTNDNDQDKKQVANTAEVLDLCLPPHKQSVHKTFQRSTMKRPFEMTEMPEDGNDQVKEQTAKTAKVHDHPYTCPTQDVETELKNLKEALAKAKATISEKDKIIKALRQKLKRRDATIAKIFEESEGLKLFSSEEHSSLKLSFDQDTLTLTENEVVATREETQTH